MVNKKAFPCDYDSGMDLRDWFAGMALQGLLAKYGVTEVCSMSHAYQAEEAYAQADKMMAEREKESIK